MGVSNATADDYTTQLLMLMPTGPAWPREGDSPGVRLLGPAGAALVALQARANKLIEEADARTASELLADWERVVGLPDPCLDPPGSMSERHRRVVQRLTFHGGQSIPFFIGFLAALGYPGCTITEFRPMRANSKCNAAINQGGWRYGWRVSVPAATNVKRMNVRSRCNERLATWGDPGLLCLLAVHKPAHTRLFVGYGA